MVERNIIMGKAGGTAGKNSVNYKISLPAEMVKELGVTQEDKSVLLDLFCGGIIIIKNAEKQEPRSVYEFLSMLADKARPKSPIINKYYYWCPVCKSKRSIRQKHNYCHDCGQTLKWESDVFAK